MNNELKNTKESINKIFAQLEKNNKLFQTIQRECIALLNKIKKEFTNYEAMNFNIINNNNEILKNNESLNEYLDNKDKYKLTEDNANILLQKLNNKINNNNKLNITQKK